LDRPEKESFDRHANVIVTDSQKINKATDMLLFSLRRPPHHRHAGPGDDLDAATTRP